MKYVIMASLSMFLLTGTALSGSTLDRVNEKKGNGRGYTCGLATTRVSRRE